MLTRHRLVLAGPDPQADHVAQAGLLEPGDEATEPAMLSVIAKHAGDCLQYPRVAGHHRDDAAHSGRARTLPLLRAHHCAQYRIE